MFARIDLRDFKCFTLLKLPYVVYVGPKLIKR